MLMPGHLLLYHPGVREAEGARRLGRARRGPLRLRQPPEPRHDPAATRTRSGASASTTSRSSSTSSARSRREVWARGESFLKQGVEDVVFCYLRFPSGKAAHMHLSWLDPHKMRRMTVVGKDKMAVFDDMELDRKVTVYDSAAEPSLRTLRRVEDAHRRHLQPARPERRAAAPRMRALPLPRPRRGRPARRRARRARRRARAGAAPGLARARARMRRASPRPRSSIRGPCSGRTS